MGNVPKRLTRNEERRAAETTETHLDIAEVEVEHAVGDEDVVQQGDVGGAGEECLAAVRPSHILFCAHRHGTRAKRSLIVSGQIILGSHCHDKCRLDGRAERQMRQLS